jgi:hypothetical protein
MFRTFLITFKQKDGNERKRVVMVSNPSGDIGKDAKTALGIFIASTGTLKKNEIVFLQEIDKDNKPVGEPITPVQDSSVVPTPMH